MLVGDAEVDQPVAAVWRLDHVGWAEITENHSDLMQVRKGGGCRQADDDDICDIDPVVDRVSVR